MLVEPWLWTLRATSYLSGGTRSNNFPITPGAFQTILRGGSDAFVLKLNPAGDQLVYSTYLGGTREEGFEGGGLALDAAGQAYVTGVTDSLDFPTSRITFQRSFGGGSSDAFVTKLSADGARLVYSTYLGGFDLDQGLGIAVDSAGRAYVTGRTRSPNLVIHNAYQGLRRSTLDDAFLTKFNAQGDLVTYSTFLGGSGNEAAHGIAVDDSGLAYLVGRNRFNRFCHDLRCFQEGTWRKRPGWFHCEAANHGFQIRFSGLFILFWRKRKRFDPGRWLLEPRERFTSRASRTPPTFQRKMPLRTSSEGVPATLLRPS